MIDGESAPPETSRGGDERRGGGFLDLPTWVVFLGVALGHIAVAFVLNRILRGDSALPGVLLETVPLDSPHPPASGHLGRWELFGLLLTPVALLFRIGMIALLVQMVLLGMWVQTSIREVFRAGVWAQGALLLGSVIQVTWIASGGPNGFALEPVEVMPGSLAAFLPFLTSGPHIELLLAQVTVFDFGWCALFILALEDRRRVPLAAAAVSVSLVWLCLTATKWVLLLYLMGVR